MLLSNNLHIPSYKEQYAVVFDDYMDTLGGGERSALAFALALQKMDFNVEILSTRKVPSSEKIEEVYGNEFANIVVRQVRTDDIAKYLLHSELRVFVNHTYMSFHRNPAKIGIYAQMFPAHAVSHISHPNFFSNLQSYRWMLSNSSFTKTYTDGLWEFPEDRSSVLNPPIGSEFVRISSNEKFFPKEKKFIHIGRFNPGNHNKNQMILMRSFIKALSINPLLYDWSFTFIGNVNSDPESLKYFDECAGLARSYSNIKILQNLKSPDLHTELESAFGYVHGTGAFLPPGVSPHACEHFGLSIVESMAYGCIPLTYGRGGIFDVVSVGENGFIYLSEDGLTKSILGLSELWGSSKAMDMQNSARRAAAMQSHEKFTSRLANFIAES